MSIKEKSMSVCLHMSRVSKIDPALIGSFIASILQAYNRLACSKLLLREIAFVFLGFFRADGWLSKFLHLKNNKYE